MGAHLPIDEARLRPHLRVERERQQADGSRVEPARASAEGTSTTSPAWKMPAGDDLERLRGLPAIGRNVRGSIRGTDPLSETIKRAERRGR